MLTFYDEIATANNPLPPGILVSVYGGIAVQQSSFVAKNYVLLGGLVDVTLQASGTYTATFAGGQAPSVTVTFETDANGNAVVSVPGYRSPSMSATGFALEQVRALPKRMFAEDDTSPGGTTYNIMEGVGGLLAGLDTLVEATLAALRLPTSLGANFQLPLAFDEAGSMDSGVGVLDVQSTTDAIDSWVFDFFGTIFTRPPDMNDAQWIAIVQAMMVIPKMTPDGIRQVLALWWPWILADASVATTGQGMGLDTFGGLDIPTSYFDSVGGNPSLLGRNIVVFDTQVIATPTGVELGNGTLATYLSLPKNRVVIYFQNPNNPDSGIGTIASPSTLLTNIVKVWKAAGITPVYAEN